MTVDRTTIETRQRQKNARKDVQIKPKQKQTIMPGSEGFERIQAMAIALGFEVVPGVEGIRLRKVGR